MSASIRTVYILDDTPAGVFLEHACVRAKTIIREGDVEVPAGATGAIVHVHVGKDAFEVEFTHPIHAVVGVRASEIEAA